MGREGCTPGSLPNQGALPGKGCTIDYDVDQAIQAYRNETAQRIADHGDPFTDTKPPGFTNPTPGNSTTAALFLHHLDLDTRRINHVLEQAYPYLERNKGLKQRIHARVKFLAWMTLKGHEHVLTAYHALLADPQTIHLLGFETLPAYDTIRECLNDRLTPPIKAQLMQALLAEQARLLDTLGDEQAQDATPVKAARFEEDCPYNGYREVEMHRCELRWDPEHEALLTQQYYHGTCKEDRWVLPFNTRLHQAGIRHGTLTVDGGYTALHLVAKSWEQGTRLRFKAKKHWDLDLDAAREDVETRYNKHWEHEAYLKDAGLEQKATFLVRHGTDNDVEAVGKWVRNRQIEELSEAEEAARRWIRSRNEGLHRPLKRLPFEASWKGQARMLARVQTSCLTLHLIQLTRLQNGVTDGLARTAHIL